MIGWAEENKELGQGRIRREIQRFGERRGERKFEETAGVEGVKGGGLKNWQCEQKGIRR